MSFLDRDECNRLWLLKKYVSRIVFLLGLCPAEFFFFSSVKRWLAEPVLLVG